MVDHPWMIHGPDCEEKVLDFEIGEGTLRETAFTNILPIKKRKRTSDSPFSSVIKERTNDMDPIEVYEKERKSCSNNPVPSFNPRKEGVNNYEEKIGVKQNKSCR
jgi:hypothetical protein